MIGGGGESEERWDDATGAGGAVDKWERDGWGLSVATEGAARS